MTGPDDWVIVAIIGRPHALRGGVAVKPLTRTIDDFVNAPLEKVHLRRDGRFLGMKTIETIHNHSGTPIVFFKEVEDRAAAEELRGAEIVIPEDERWPLPEGEYYADELKGFVIRDADTGDQLGTVKLAREGAAQDYLIMPHPGDPKREVMIPNAGEIVLKIDVEAREVLVRLPEGLMDI